MLEIPQLAVAAPSALSACCLAATPARSSWRAGVPAVLSLAAMLLAAVPGVPSLALLAAAVVVGASGLVAVPRGRAHPMDLHRALSALAMAGLLVGMAGHTLRAAGTGSTKTMHHSAAATGCALLALAVYLAFSLALVAAELRPALRPPRAPRSQPAPRPPRVPAGPALRPPRAAGRPPVGRAQFLRSAEVAAMAASVALMAAML